MVQTGRAEITHLPWWMPVALVAAFVIVYANSLNCPFVLDDFQVIVQNEGLRRLWPPTLRFWSDASSGTWGRPVSALTYAISYAIAPDRPANYHAVSIALHAANALLLLGIVRRCMMLPRCAGRWSTRGANGVAFVVALLWGIHPLVVDAVTYLSGRPELLFALCMLVAIYAMLREWRGVCIAACFVGVGCKEPMVVAPVVILLFDGIMLGSSPWAALRARWRFYLVLACSWIVLAALLLRPELAIREDLDSLTPWTYLKMQAGVIVHYFRLSVWPSPLVIDYYDWPIAHRLTSVLPQALFILALLGLTIWALVRRHWLGFVGAWVVLILAPTSSIHPIGIEPATERRMYMPLAGIVAAMVILIAELVRRRPRSLGLTLSGAAIVAVVFALFVIRRNQDFRDQLTLTRAALDARPNNARMWIAHGQALAIDGDEESALGAYEMAVRSDPKYPRAYLARGNQFARVRRFDEAAADFDSAARLDPAMPEPHLELGKLHLAQNRTAPAEAEFRRAMELYPQWRDPRTWLAGLMIQERRLAEAEELLSETARQYPDAPAVREVLRRLRAVRESETTRAATRAVTSAPALP